jgi:hypothetical protein
LPLHPLRTRLYFVLRIKRLEKHVLVRSMAVQKGARRDPR